MAAGDPPAERPEDVSAWLAAAHAGSDEALGRVFDLCRAYLLQVANGEMESRLRAKVGASDLVQETYLEAHRIFDRFGGRTPEELRAWLRAILLNKLATAARHYAGTAKRQLGREVPIDADATRPVAPPAGGPTASSIYARHERMEALMAALGRLPEDYRKVVLWRQVEGLSFDDVAARLGRTPDAARKLWWRALQALQGELGEAL